MAQLPTGYQLSGPVSLRSGRMISSADETAIGRGMASFGGAVADAGASIRAVAERERQRQNTIDLARANAYQDQANVDLLNSFDRDPDYATFGVRAPKKANEIAATAADLIRDPEVRELWKLQAGTTAKKTADAVADKGFVLSRQADVAAFDEALEVQRRLYIDPNTPEDAKEKARASLEASIEVALGSGLLTPEGAQQYRALYLDGSDFERAKLDTTIASPREAYFAAIRSAESGGNDDAANPKSSARGRYQFLQGTWDDLVARYPEAGLTRGGRFDPAQQEKAIRLFTAENEQALAAAGVPATNGNLYAAHFLGVGAATNVLSASDGTPMVALVDGEVIAANPFLQGMTVGEFKSWATRKGGGTGSIPAYVERLPADQRQAVLDMRAAEQARALTAATAQAKVEYETRRSAMELGILTGDVVSEQQVLSADLDDDDKATLLRSLRTEQNATAEARALLGQIADGTASLNPYSSDHRAAAGKAYDLMITSLPEEQRASAAAVFVQETGIVPTPVVADVRQKLLSDAPADVAAGLQQAAALFDTAPQGLEAVEHGRELRDAAATYDELVNGRGLSVEQAAQQVLAMRDPANVKKREILETDWKQAVKDDAFPVSDVLAAYDGGFGVGQPSGGMTREQQAALSADYLDAAERAFMGQANGDVGLAKKMALTEMQRTYGVSSVTGSRVLMKYPPENFYPAINGDQTYIRELALKDAKSMDPSAQNVMLVPSPGITPQDVRAGTLPRYDLFYQREDGAWDLAPDMFTISTEDVDALNRLASEERRIMLEDARSRVPSTSDAGPLGLMGWGVRALSAIKPTDPALQTRLDEIGKERRSILGVEDADATDWEERERQYLLDRASDFATGLPLGGAGG